MSIAQGTMNIVALAIYIATISASAVAGYAFGRDTMRTEIFDKLHVDNFDARFSYVHIGTCAYSVDGLRAYCANIEEHPQFTDIHKKTREAPASAVTSDMLQSLKDISANTRTLAMAAAGEDPAGNMRTIKVDKDGNVMCSK